MKVIVTRPRAQAGPLVERLEALTFDEALATQVICGTPDSFTARLREVQDEIGLDGQVLFNPGSPTTRRSEPTRTMGELVLAGGRIVERRIVDLGP